MKIQGNKPAEGQEISINAQRTGKVDVKEKLNQPEKIKSTNDRVDISGKGKEIAELMAQINELPDIRTDKVNAIKKTVEAGNYKIDPMKIAEKFLDEI